MATVLSPIYDRLKAASGYSPFTANTFGDWSLEAGDVVKISRNGEERKSPVYTSKFTWKGSSEVSIESGGKQKRESVTEMERNKYGRRGGGARNNKNLSERIEKGEGKISLVVEETDDGGNVIKAASIVTAINEDGSSIRLSADRIELHGKTIAETIDAESLKVDGLIAGTTLMKKCYADKAEIVGTITAAKFQINLGDGAGYANLNQAYHAVSKSTSGNNITLTFTRMDGTSIQNVDSVTFSRAVAEWGEAWSTDSSGNRKLTVTANPQNQQRVYGFSASGSWGTGANLNKYSGKIQYFVGNDDENKYNTGIEYTVYRSIEGWTEGWSDDSGGNRKLTITASPQTQERVYGFAKSGSWSGNTYTWKVKYFVGNDDESKHSTGIEGTVSREITGWTEGWSNYSSGDYRKFTITPSPQGAGQARVYGFAKSGSWSGNTYAWKVKYFVGNDDGTTYNTGIEGSVSRAVTSWGTSWSNSGKLTVTANPQGQSTAYGLVDHGGSWSDGTFTGKVYYYENNDDEHSWDTHFRYTVTNVVDSWSRTPFAADTTTRAYKQLSIPVSVNVNGKTYSNTFTTPNITLVKQGEAVVDVKCGTTTIARLVLYDD